jgi:hypothetical protein
MRVQLLRRPLGPEKYLLFTALFATLIPGGKGLAQTPALPAPHTTFVIFAERGMHDGEWVALVAALKRTLTAGAESTSAVTGGVDFIRGDEVVPGLRVDKSITVYLHGDCTLVPQPWRAVQGALGWVPRVHGRIEPFVHVECERIVQMLGPLALGMSNNRRNTVMGEAMARVILHEFVHIATQSSSHTAHGVSKSKFGVADLLADDDETLAQSRLRDKKKEPRL